MVALFPGPPIPTTTSSARESASNFQYRSSAAIPRSRTAFSRPATNSAGPTKPGTIPKWNWLPSSQLTSNDSSRLARACAPGCPSASFGTRP